MLKEAMIFLFDTQKIQVGDVVRYSRLGSSKQPRLGLVQKICPDRMSVIYCNLQNGKTSFQTLTATDVAAGIYTLDWSRDLQQVFSTGPENNQGDNESDLPDLEEDSTENEENLLEDVDFSVSAPEL